MKTLLQPQGLAKKHFVKMQESQQKDVERAFGVLQAWFAIVLCPPQGWKNHNLHNIMKTCIILHKMVVEYERGKLLNYSYDHSLSEVITQIQETHQVRVSFSDFIDNFHMLRDVNTHHQLREDLINHQWDFKACMEEDED